MMATSQDSDHLWEEQEGIGTEKGCTSPSAGPVRFSFFSWVVGPWLCIMWLLALFVSLKCSQ